MSNEHSFITLLQPQLELLPADLHKPLEIQWQGFVEALQREQLALPETGEWLTSLAKVWACSDFVAKGCGRYPAMFCDLVESRDLFKAYPAGRYGELLRQQMEEVADENALMVLLRHFRRREMVRIAWRDIAAWADLDETLRELSALASACVDMALAKLHEWQVAESGMPIGELSGEPQNLVVLGMGKLGANELNFSSDIDLIFAYPEDGQTQGGRRELSNGEYFVRLARRLINVLNQQTAEGYVFRVDMRLRPFGDAGPLAISFDAMENYYQVHGREWERYAFIKANVIAGDRIAGLELLQLLQPFVYRRYIDYGAFESLREMKEMISQQVKRKGMEDNIKLGAGGIREVEFTGQAYQLIRGGREKGLRVRPILQVLAYLAENDYIPVFVQADLTEAYIFLRRTENRLQEMADQQTHVLPKNELDRQRLALAMNYDSYDAFYADLRYHMDAVHNHFEQAFTAPQREQAAEQGSIYDGIWDGSVSGEAAEAILAEQGFDAVSESLQLLTRLRESPRYIGMTPKGRDRVDRLMPLLLGAVAATANPSQTLARLLDLLQSIARRTAYLALLVENPLALSQLVKLCAASSWIAKHLSRYPVLLDELLDPRSLYRPLDRARLETELQQTMEQVGDDLEQQMEVMRHFKQANVLRVAAADVSGIYPLMAVSDHLTGIAEVEVQQAMEMAYHYLQEKYGRPSCLGQDGKSYEPGFIVLAYGKMGGIELGYGSDLDLVFIHGNYNCGGQTDGESVVDNMVFFARLGQRIIHIITARTPSGILYETDARLRPSGEAGMLVNSLNGFAIYQEKEAWTWEHQALVRARVVAGSPGLAKRFAVIRRKVLGRERDPVALQKEVREMRERMREQLSKGKGKMFDLKQDEGGIADIEFIVQYAVLRWSHDYPELLTWTDNVRLLKVLAAEDLMTEVDARWLTMAYLAYREAGHRLTLQDEPAMVPLDEFDNYRREVARIWHNFMDAQP